MAKFEFNEAAMRKLEKDVQKKIDVAVAKHPFKKGDSLVAIEKTLEKLFRSLGVTPNARNLKAKAQEIFGNLNK